MSKESKELARQILKDGICNMSIEKLIQMSHFGLTGFIESESKTNITQNMFNHIEHDEESNVIIFMAKGAEDRVYGSVSFVIDAIKEISGCEDTENPETMLNINITLEDDVKILIKVIY